MKKTEKRTTYRKSIPQGAPISPGKHLSARSRPRESNWNKKDALGVWDTRTGSTQPNRTTAGQGLPAVIAGLTRWAKPGTDISIGNQRRIKAIRKTNVDWSGGSRNATQQGANQALARRKKQIHQNRMETGGRGEREIFELASSKQQRLFSRCALACSLGEGYSWGTLF